MRFSVREPTILRRGGSSASQERNRDEGFSFPQKRREESPFKENRRPEKFSSISQFWETRPLKERRRPRQSFLLYNILEIEEQSTMGTRAPMNRSFDKTDQMVYDIVDDVMQACTARSDEINLHKLGLKLTLQEYSSGDTLETFLRFVKEATKSLSLAKLLRPDLAGWQTDLLGQMLKGKP